MESESKISSFENYVKKHHLFVLTLAICPSLAVTTTFEGAYILGLIVLITTFLSSFFSHLLARVVPSKFRLYLCLLINAIFITIWEFFLYKYLHDLYLFFGIYLSIIAVNFMIMQRAMFYAPHHKLSKTLIDALKCGFFFLLLISSVGLIREFIGHNTITLMDKISPLTGYLAQYQILPSNNFIPNSLFLTSAGAFLTLGILLSIIYYIKNWRASK